MNRLCNKILIMCTIKIRCDKKAALLIRKKSLPLNKKNANEKKCFNINILFSINNYTIIRTNNKYLVRNFDIFKPPSLTHAEWKFLKQKKITMIAGNSETESILLVIKELFFNIHIKENLPLLVTKRSQIKVSKKQ